MRKHRHSSSPPAWPAPPAAPAYQPPPAAPRVPTAARCARVPAGSRGCTRVLSANRSDRVRSASGCSPPRHLLRCPSLLRPCPPGTLRVEAELGAHKQHQFLQGLSGNDVIDSGGIFVATYQIPPVGQALSLRVSMPGGYEFEALGVVRWTRDAPNSGADGAPGFGAQFTQITPKVASSCIATSEIANRCFTTICESRDMRAQ